MNKVLLIIENETSLASNHFFDEAIVQERLKEKDFDVLFQIVFSNANYQKILAFRRINFEEDNKFDQRFYTSDDYKECFGNFDFRNMFSDIVKTMNIDFCGYICGGDFKSIEFLESVIEKKLVLLNPYDLFDRDIYFRK